MVFEYDPQKSQANKAKHRIDFEEAQALWDDPYGVEFPSTQPGEERFARVAQLSKSDPRIWVAIFTLREEIEGCRTRIISVHRARKNEEKLYEQQAKTEDR